MKDLEFKTLINSIKRSNDIVEVINERYSLDKTHRMLCPFHEDEHPSFSVNQEEQYFYCFGCGVGGDVINFTMLDEKIGFSEALHYLAQRAGILIHESPEMLKELKSERQIQDILSETVKFYSKDIPADVMAHLTQKRGLTKETISQFRIGYSKPGLRRHLINICKFDPEQCIKAGVLRRNPRGVIEDYFKKRIILPTLWQGRVVFISGRALGDIEPKYLHLPSEKKRFFNEEALCKKEVYITEGIFDCLSMIQKSYPCVAIQGANLKDGEVSKFSKCERIYLCLDGDDSGKEATAKIAKTIGLKARIIIFPDNADPNEYFLTRSRDDFEILKNSSLDYICFQINTIPQEINRTDLYHKVAQIMNDLAACDEPYVQAILKENFKTRFKMTEKELDDYRKLINRLRKQDNTQREKALKKTDVDKPMRAKFDGLVDIAKIGDETVYLVQDGEKLKVEHVHEINDVIYVPPTEEMMDWLLPDADKVIQHYGLYRNPDSYIEILSQLYDDIRTYLKSASELPSDEYYDLLTTWVFHTYLQEQCHYSPILCFFSVAERGKSRTGKALISMAYRGTHEETLREPCIFRTAERCNSTIFFDVTDLRKKVERLGSEDILLNRFERGVKSKRVLYPDRPDFHDERRFSLFGPTIIATNEPLDRVLETRAITVNMKPSSRRFENDIILESGLPLKERLIAFRARFLSNRLEDILKPADGRLGDILKPIIQVIRLVKPEKENVLIQLIRKIEKDRKIEKSETIEAQILQVICSLKPKVVRGYLQVKLITDTLNKKRNEINRISYQKVGCRLKAMGFQKSNLGKDGASWIQWDEDLLSKNMENMGVEKMSDSSDSSDSSVEEIESNYNSDLSCVSDIFPDTFTQIFNKVPNSEKSNGEKESYFKRGIFE